ncbi:hypothetical protein SHKM778_79760 [Streptomyces sp. KM77-8]|uniref:Probable sugar-binding periplasmic protein n=1 Tax=Streptomyces haneummycinicus TaxID=3074435 RepID=A0AAT9HWE3_9ACTN
MPKISRKATFALAATASLTLLATACTGQSGSGATDDLDAETTITFWHGWSAPAEVKAVQANVDRFERAHPNIKVKVVGNINDDKLNQALRAGGSSGPDVVSSFTTSNVGKFCSSGAFLDLKPFIEKSKLDLDAIVPEPMLDYTQFEGTRCALPCSATPTASTTTRTPSRPPVSNSPQDLVGVRRGGEEADEDQGDGYERLGFMPNYHGYETVVDHYMSQWDHAYFDADGKSNIAGDPAFAEMFTYQKKLVDDLGGFARLEKYRNTFGDEWGAKHPSTPGRWRCSSTASGVSAWRGTPASASRSAPRRCRSPTTRRTSTARASSPARSWASPRGARSRTPPGSW